jgi:acetyl-CoA C-acetyltransferase
MTRETVMNAVVDRAGLTIGDNGLWEPHKAVASQTVYRRDRLGIAPEPRTVKGVAAGHPIGWSGLV